MESIIEFVNYVKKKIEQMQELTIVILSSLEKSSSMEKKKILNGLS